MRVGGRLLECDEEAWGAGESGDALGGRNQSRSLDGKREGRGKPSREVDEKSGGIGMDKWGSGMN
jgi:hypothetical protein